MPRNSEKFISGRSPIDLMLEISSNADQCAIYLVSGDVSKNYCPSCCPECIRDWLNEESNTQVIGSHKCKNCGAAIPAARQYCRKCDPYETWEEDKEGV